MGWSQPSWVFSGGSGPLPNSVHCPSADGGKHVVQVLKSQDEDHYILYCEGDMHGQQI